MSTAKDTTATEAVNDATDLPLVNPPELRMPEHRVSVLNFILFPLALLGCAVLYVRIKQPLLTWSEHGSAIQAAFSPGSKFDILALVPASLRHWIALTLFLSGTLMTLVVFARYWFGGPVPTLGRRELLAGSWHRLARLPGRPGLLVFSTVLFCVTWMAVGIMPKAVRLVGQETSLAAMAKVENISQYEFTEFACRDLELPIDSDDQCSLMFDRPASRFTVSLGSYRPADSAVVLRFASATPLRVAAVGKMLDGARLPIGELAICADALNDGQSQLLRVVNFGDATALDVLVIGACSGDPGPCGLRTDLRASMVSATESECK